MDTNSCTFALLLTDADSRHVYVLIPMHVHTYI